MVESDACSPSVVTPSHVNIPTCSGPISNSAKLVYTSFSMALDRNEAGKSVEPSCSHIQFVTGLFALQVRMCTVPVVRVSLSEEVIVTIRGSRRRKRYIARLNHVSERKGKLAKHILDDNIIRSMKLYFVLSRQLSRCEDKLHIYIYIYNNCIMQDTSTAMG